MALGCKRRLATPVIQMVRKLGLLNTYGLLRTRLVGLSARILAYHRVNQHLEFPCILLPVSTQSFEEQIKYLCQRYKIVSLTELCNTLIKGENIRENTIAITFDDGYKDNYLNAYPILKKYNVTATIFLVTGYIGTGNLFWWDKVSYVIHNTTLERLELDSFGIYPLKTTQQRSLAVSVIIERLKGIQDGDKNSVIEELISISGVDIPSNLGKELILSWAEVREMAKNGIDFGAHTVNHPILTRLPLEEARKEIIESKKCMEDELDRPVNAFSYPNGGPTDFNEDIKKIIKDSGFFCAVTDAPPKLVVPGTDLYELGRIAPGWDLGTLQLCISGLYPDLVTMWSRVSRVHR